VGFLHSQAIIRAEKCLPSRENILRTEQNQNMEQNKKSVEVPMIRVARESLALVSVAGFVWMMCSVAQLVA